MIRQEEKIMSLLEEKGEVSDEQARKLGIFHLPVIISKLRKKLSGTGREIKTLTSVNNSARFTSYQLIK